MISGVYKISSLCKPERCYIGSSKDIHKRWDCHLREFKKQKHHSVKLQRHYDKYGKNDLVFSIIIGCEKDELIQTEQYFIDVYNPYFNGMKKAGSNGGFKHTEEAKQKISDAFKGEKNPNYHREFTPEHRKRIGEARKGKSSNKGYKWTEEQRENLSKALTGRLSPHKGYQITEETRKKQSEAKKGKIPWNKGKKYPHKGYTPSEETKEKLRKASTGRTHTEETKRKMSEARSKYYMMKRLNNVELLIN